VPISANSESAAVPFSANYMSAFLTTMVIL